MAIVEVRSESSSFEANVFAISQAQRFLVLCIMNDADRPEWAEDLAEDLSYSSWNNLYKSFGLLEDDGYFAKGYGQSFIWYAAVLRSAISAIDRITYDDFLAQLSIVTIFDEREEGIDAASIKQQFYPDRLPHDGRAALVEIQRIYSNILRITGHLNETRTAAPTKEEIYRHIKDHVLFRVIRGEIAVFRTPAEINAELLPTDHDQLLIVAIYPLAEQYSRVFIERELDVALRLASSDALGVFCAIRCYFMQIMNEDNGIANIKLDRVGLAQFLTARYFAFQDGLNALVMAEQPDRKGYAQRMALSYLRTLQSKHGVQLTVD